jgi:hypothetical protein
MKGPMVFILGAGASKPYGYPLAQELVEQIAFDDPHDKSPLRTRHEFEGLQKNLATSKARSVDVFLGRDSQKRFQDVGLWAIAEKLIKCEQRNNIFGRTTEVGPPHQRSVIDDDWYAYLFNTLTEHITDLKDVGTLPISFITFNYDRSLEYFLERYLSSNFPDNPPSEIWDTVGKIEIRHVYGRLDKFQWEVAPQQKGRDYTDTITQQTVKTAAAGIRVMHQGADSPDTKAELVRAGELMAEADAIFFLGFGYHPQNMARLHVPFDRLEIRVDRKQIRQVFGTVYKMTVAEANAIRNIYSKNKMVTASVDHKITEALRNNGVFLSMLR